MDLLPLPQFGADTGQAGTEELRQQLVDKAKKDGHVEQRDIFAVLPETPENAEALERLDLAWFQGQLVRRTELAELRTRLDAAVDHVLDTVPGDIDDIPPRGTHRPGEAFFYSNWAFNALGTAVERGGMITAASGVHPPRKPRSPSDARTKVAPRPTTPMTTANHPGHAGLEAEQR